MTKIEKTSLILTFALVATIGLLSIPQNAFAGFEEEFDPNQNIIHCEMQGILEEDTFFGDGFCDVTLFTQSDEVFIEATGTISDVVFDEEDCGTATVNWTLTFFDSEGGLILDDSTLKVKELSEICFFGFNGDSIVVFFGITNVTGGTGTFANACRGEGVSFEILFAEDGGLFFGILWQEIEFCNNSGGGSCTNCQQPSIGVTERGTRVVDGGLTVNGQTVHASFYHTPFPLIQSEIGKPIDFVFKIWDDRADNIKHVQIQLGKNKVGESFNKVASAIWDRNVMTGIETVTHDPMFTNVIMEKLEDQPCRTGGVPCTVIHASLTPTQPIVGDVVFGINIWDQGNNAVTSFFNEGLQVGTQADIIVPDTSNTVVIKKQQRFDDGIGNVDDRNSEAFQMKLAWHNNNIIKIAQELGY